MKLIKCNNYHRRHHQKIEGQDLEVVAAHADVQIAESHHLARQQVLYENIP
jgi:hypothetical protein